MEVAQRSRKVHLRTRGDTEGWGLGSPVPQGSSPGRVRNHDADREVEAGVQDFAAEGVLSGDPSCLVLPRQG